MKKASELKSITEELDRAALKGQEVTKETLRSFVKNDIKGVYLLLAEILRSEECIDALTDIFYERYTSMTKKDAN